MAARDTESLAPCPPAPCAAAPCVPSPCISLCKLDDAGHVCVGCHRTLAEIRRWKDADAAERRAIRRAAEARAGKIRAGKAGQA